MIKRVMWFWTVTDKRRQWSLRRLKDCKTHSQCPHRKVIVQVTEVWNDRDQLWGGLCSPGPIRTLNVSSLLCRCPSGRWWSSSSRCRHTWSGSDGPPTQVHHQDSSLTTNEVLIVIPIVALVTLGDRWQIRIALASPCRFSFPRAPCCALRGPSSRTSSHEHGRPSSPSASAGTSAAFGGGAPASSPTSASHGWREPRRRASHPDGPGCNDRRSETSPRSEGETPDLFT